MLIMNLVWQHSKSIRVKCFLLYKIVRVLCKGCDCLDTFLMFDLMHSVFVNTFSRIGTSVLKRNCVVMCACSVSKVLLCDMSIH